MAYRLVHRFHSTNVSFFTSCQDKGQALLYRSVSSKQETSVAILEWRPQAYAFIEQGFRANIGH
jgi:hypothetical protein